MKPLFRWLLLLGCLALGRPAQAQFNPMLYPWLYSGATYQHCHCCCCCHQRDTTTVTEHNNRWGVLSGPTLLLDRQGRAHGGVFLEVGRAVSPRLTVGGYLLVSANREATSSYGTEATAPAVGLHALSGTVRYQLLNSRRWRVETLAGLGLGAVQLVDRDQQIINPKGGSYAATVAFRVHPLAEVGLGTSWKVARDFWLTSRASYTNLALSSGLGEPGEFSYWNVSVGAAMPWGWR
ncbi:MAG: hypothetical protein ACRYFX_06355 [Janthinobacterium lividum]